MSGKIFINYRRGDDPGFTRALYLRLESEFSPQQLFMDVEGAIRPGDDFVDVLTHQVQTSDVVLVVIGPRWVDALHARRDDPDDFVQIEIKAAIDLGKRVIPVLVGGATMPPGSVLPPAIQSLSRRNALDIRPERFAADSQGLCRALKEIMESVASEAAGRIVSTRTEAGPPITAIKSGGVTDHKFAHQFAMRSGSLARALKKALFAMSSDQNRYYLNGFYLHPSSNTKGQPTLRIVATDGHRLVLVEMIETAGLARMPGVIVPRDSAYEIYAFLESASGDVNVAVSPSEVRFAMDSRFIACTPIDGTYPDYGKVVPTKSFGEARIPIKETIDALEMLSLSASAETAAVVFELTGGSQPKLRLRLNKDSDRRSMFEVSVLSSSGAQTIGFNASYVVDILKRVDGSAARIVFGNAGEAASFYGADEADTTFVLMPMRL